MLNLTNDIIADAFDVLKPGDLLTFLACVGVLLGIALGVKKLFFDGPKPITPQPLLISLEKDFVKIDEFHRRHREIDQKLAELRQDMKRENEELRQFLRHLSSEANVRGERLSAIESESKTHTRQLSGLDQRIGALTEALGYTRGRVDGKLREQ